jgi:hypothetical protein
VLNVVVSGLGGEVDIVINCFIITLSTFCALEESKHTNEMKKGSRLFTGVVN